MKPMAIRLQMQTRTINIEGTLRWHRLIVKPTKAHQQPNQWYVDLLDNLRKMGFTVTEDRTRAQGPDLPL